MSITYKFKSVKLDNGSYTKRPYIDVILRNGTEYMEFAAILDSGSDVTSIPKHVAECLGIKIQGKKEKMIGVAGSSNEIYYGTITLILKGKTQRNNIMLNGVSVGIIDDENEDDVIIGTKSVFERLRIVFNDSKSISVTKLPFR